MVHNDALHHPRQAVEGCWAGAGPGHQEGTPLRLSPVYASAAEKARGTHQSTRASQRPRGCCLPTPIPPLEDGGLRTPCHAWSPLHSATWEGPCCPGRQAGRPVGCLLCHRLHTPLGRGERWNHLPNMQKRREDSFLSGKHGQEGSPCFLY